MSPNKTLESRLLYLPISLESRVQLWLTYKNLKPASAIKTRIPFNKNARLKKWLKDTGLEYSQDQKHKEIIYVSKSKNLLDKISKIMWSEKPNDIVKKGKLFGYPEKATKAFVDNQSSLMTITPANNPKYWAAYIRYMIRKDHFDEDTQIAKKWADCIRKDLPLLAKWYEKELQKATIK